MRWKAYGLATQNCFLWPWVPVEGERVHCLLSPLPGETDLQSLVSGFDHGSLVVWIPFLFHWLQLLCRYLNHVQLSSPDLVRNSLEQQDRSENASDL